MGAEAEVAGTRVCERWVSLERMGTRKEGDSRKEGCYLVYWRPSHLYGDIWLTSDYLS
jgi:hypothetical protein